MGFLANREQLQALLTLWSEKYRVYAPRRIHLGGRFSDTDVIRYDSIDQVDDIVFDEKSAYSFKEALTPVAQTLFFFTEKSVKEADAPDKGAIVFLRSCDLHAVRRLDQIYLKNGEPDYYYDRLRENVRFVLMGCSQSFDNCFCVSMHSNIAPDNYEMAINARGDCFELDSRVEEWSACLKKAGAEDFAMTPDCVKTNDIEVTIPENLDHRVAASSIWTEYDSRCIGCGRCNFVCPTCTCYTMQDLFYTDNGRVGERRRVQASCMVDGYTEVAGGGAYRQRNGARMRFKALHKALDFKQRNGYQMCVGCGRCDDICPEYISFSAILNKLEKGMEEVLQNEQDR